MQEQEVYDNEEQAATAAAQLLAQIHGVVGEAKVHNREPVKDLRRHYNVTFYFVADDVSEDVSAFITLLVSHPPKPGKHG